MKDVDKARFLDAPISQGGLFGDTVEGFAKQFSAVQQQSEAIQHILPRRDAPSTAAPGARPQSARRRGRPPASSRAAPPQAESTHMPVRRASRRRAAPPASQPGPKSSRKSTKRPWRGQSPERERANSNISGDGENSAAPSPGGGPGGESSISFCFCSAAGPRASPESPCLARGDCCPPGKGCNQAGPLQPRWGRGFTALTSSYPRKVVAFGQSWICESWTGLCTSSRSRCWRTGAWSNAFSPRIGLQRSTWRTLTFTFRSFRDTDRFYGLRSKVGHGSTGSSPSGSPCLPVCSRRL